MADELETTGREVEVMERTGLELRKAKMLALVMLEGGHKYAHIMEATGLSRGTVANVSKGRDAYTSEVATRMRRQERDKLTFIMDGILDSIDDQDIQAATLAQKGVVYGIFNDKRDAIELDPSDTPERKYTDEELLREINRENENLAQYAETLAGYSDMEEAQIESPAQEDDGS